MCAKIKPFRAVRPVRDKVHLVPTLPYYTYPKIVLESKLKYNRYTFLQIINPEYNSVEKTDPNSDERFQAVRDRYNEFRKSNILKQDEEHTFYLYRQSTKTNVFTGIICGASCQDYNDGVIKVHEQTLTKREETFRRYLDIVGFNAEPVLLTYSQPQELSDLYRKVMKDRPEYEFTTTNHYKHELWLINKPEQVAMIQNGVGAVKEIYIADGHHRSASSALLSDERSATNPDSEAAHHYFLSYLIPEEDLKIYEFNRIVKDLGGMSTEEFLNKVKEHFNILKEDRNHQRPHKKHHFTLYIDGCWYSMTPVAGTYNTEDPVASLDTRILSTNLLAPVLGIMDLKTDKRISFIGGDLGPSALEEKVDSGEYAVAFGLYPATVDQIKKVADANETMPPKSTWIEPKLRSGLTIYEF